MNQQPFQFIAVTDADLKAGISAKLAVADQGGPGWAQKYPMGFAGTCPRKTDKTQGEIHGF